jgi:hypothetical protein
MDYKPGDFFIGVIDFFGILVPGAVFLFLRGWRLGNWLDLHFDPDKKWFWAIFLLSAYLLGHFFLGLGVPLNRLRTLFSRSGSDAYYNYVKDKITLPSETQRNQRGHSIWRKLLRLLEDERAAAFYEAYAFVRLKSAPALAEIERQMADYKLFRSLILVFAVDFGLCLLDEPGRLARRVLSGGLCILAGWRFLFLLSWTYRITFQYYALLKADSQAASLRAGAGGKAVAAG